MLGEGEGRGEGRGEDRRGEERGERRYHFIFIPFSKNGIHLLAQFASKEMMNNVASSLRFQGREEKCSAGAPRGRGLASSGFISFFTGNDLGNRKTLPVSVIGAGAIGKGPTGHTKCSNRENSEILAHLSQDSYRKIIQITLGRGDRGEAGKAQVFRSTVLL